MLSFMVIDLIGFIATKGKRNISIMKLDKKAESMVEESSNLFMKNTPAKVMPDNKAIKFPSIFPVPISSKKKSTTPAIHKSTVKS